MEIITVKINGKEYPTHIDEHGVQRFASHPIVEKMVDTQIDVYSRKGWRWWEENKLYGLNELSIDYQTGKENFTLENMIDFHTMIGYSVSGFSSLSYFEEVEIENPLWD